VSVLQGEALVLQHHADLLQPLVAQRPTADDHEGGLVTHLPGRDFKALMEVLKDEARYQLAMGQVHEAEMLARIVQKVELNLSESQHEPSLH
jgi:xanthine/CO dehydrogenase XdhC/CoxF family maturation factor